VSVSNVCCCNSSPSNTIHCRLKIVVTSNTSTVTSIVCMMLVGGYVVSRVLQMCACYLNAALVSAPLSACVETMYCAQMTSTCL
jgi:hypothetical protein